MSFSLHLNAPERLQLNAAAAGSVKGDVAAPPGNRWHVTPNGFIGHLFHTQSYQCHRQRLGSYLFLRSLSVKPCLRYKAIRCAHGLCGHHLLFCCITCRRDFQTGSRCCSKTSEESEVHQMNRYLFSLPLQPTRSPTRSTTWGSSTTSSAGSHRYTTTRPSRTSTGAQTASGE